MKHTVRFEKRAGYASIRLRCEDSGAFAEIIPALGGMVHQVAFTSGEGPVELLKADADETLGAFDLFRGRLLFPWNDRIPGGRYVFRGKEYRLPLNDPGSKSALHGFLYAKEMRLLGVIQDDDHAFLRLGYRIRPDDMEGYPFPLALAVEYTLRENRFTISFRVENHGATDAPLAFGWHPYFRFGEDPEKAVLRAGFPSFYEIDGQALPKNGPVQIRKGDPFDFSSGRPVSGLSLDNAFAAPPDGRVYLEVRGLTLLLSQETPVFAWNQLFLPPDGKSLAVEPVTGAPDCFNHPERGLLTLSPGGSVSAAVTLSLVS